MVYATIVISSVYSSSYIFLFLSLLPHFFFFFFFNDTATTEIYTLSLHDALPIYRRRERGQRRGERKDADPDREQLPRSEEHTSELQSRLHLVCRLLLEKKKKNTNTKNKQIQKSEHRR